MLTIQKSKDRIASRQYREFIAKQSCCICKAWPCDPAHTVSRKWADGSDLTCVPLCRSHHRAFDDAGKGRMEWLAASGVDLEKTITFLQLRFRNVNGLPIKGDFTEVMKSAGFAQAPYTARKNRH